ncbi:hypothetical protein DH2020_006480 [Rehmannia glutinosa]|uniref:Uncharacterized protein n=1 Tax=Rehmannia glutinosa TaxID=99300 RepID=A0ABR0XJL5_REHGL
MSDHSPIFLELGRRYVIRKVRRFRFENTWLREKDCRSVVMHGWNTGVEGNVLGKIEKCGFELMKWGEVLQNSFQSRINEAKRKMRVYRGARDSLSVEEFRKAQDIYNQLLAQQEDFWRQRAKKFWLKGGDMNSKYFHTVASTRNIHNAISRLKATSGSWLTWENGLE